MHYANVFVLGLNYLGTKIKWKKKRKNLFSVLNSKENEVDYIFEIFE
jgi:hypothetical protein